MPSRWNEARGSSTTTLTDRSRPRGKKSCGEWSTLCVALKSHSMSSFRAPTCEPGNGGNRNLGAWVGQKAGIDGSTRRRWQCAGVDSIAPHPQPGREIGFACRPRTLFELADWLVDHGDITIHCHYEKGRSLQATRCELAGGTMREIGVVFGSASDVTYDMTRIVAAPESTETTTPSPPNPTHSSCPWQPPPLL